MTREQILKDRLQIASHNLFCCSANYLMDKPKDGYEKEHKEASEEVAMLEAWLKEFHHTNTNNSTGLEQVNQISQEALVCAAQHIRCFVEDYKYGRMGYTTIPCMTCPQLLAECCPDNKSHYRHLHELTKCTGIEISFLTHRKRNNNA